MQKIRKTKKCSSKRKLKKSKDRSRCCDSCNFCDKRNHEDPICSLTAESVKLDGVCDRIDTTVKMKCQSCGRELAYQNKDEYYGSCYKFEMESGCGNSSWQRMHLCKRCASRALDEFEDLMERISHGLLQKSDVNNKVNDNK